MAIAFELSKSCRVLFLISLYSIICVVGTMADKAKDREECAEQLAGLATCLPYVQGQAKSPTPDCCAGLKQMLKNNKKCLCVIIRDRNDPDLGLQINVTLALGLPSVCHAPADVTKCPSLLHMDPNSPEAQVFYQLAKGSSPSVTSPAPTPTGLAPTPSEEPNSSRTRDLTNGARHSKRKWLGLELFLISCLVISQSFSL